MLRPGTKELCFRKYRIIFYYGIQFKRIVQTHLTQIHWFKNMLL